MLDLNTPPAWTCAAKLPAVVVVYVVVNASRLYGLAHIARRVIQRTLNPRSLSSMAPYDVASDICQAPG